MGILLAILAGVGSILNLTMWLNEPIQIALTILSVLSMIVYKGKRTQKSYNYDGTRMFTFRFAICFMSFLGSGGILVGLLLHLT